MEIENGGAEPWLSRAEVSAMLKQLGLDVAKASLAKYAVIGGGPEFVMFGRFPRYRGSKAIEWAEGKLSKPVRSRAELTQPSD